MWNLYKTAKGANKAPSSYFLDLDEWTAFQVDDCIIFFGETIEHLLTETVLFGEERKPKYQLRQLLADDFTVRGESAGVQMSTPLKAVEGLMFDEVK